MKRTSISLPDDMAKALDREARRRGTSDAGVVITLDRRPFTVVRTRHREALELLPTASTRKRGEGAAGGIEPATPRFSARAEAHR